MVMIADKIYERKVYNIMTIRVGSWGVGWGEVGVGKGYIKGWGG